jgi:lathosterol oxidase
MESPYVKEPTIWRNAFGIWFIMSFGGALMYLSFSTLSYIFIFDKNNEKHPKFLANQKLKEIGVALGSIPIMGIFTTPLILLEVYGYSFLYDNVEEYGVPFFLLSIVTFLLFTDCLIYWIHRGLHHPWVYSTVHKPHHWWKVPTPFASHAFHPLDGFLQSVPYHIYVFFFPIHKFLYLSLFLFVNFWTISIHDGDYRVPKFMQPFINGAAHHTEHHLRFTCNYGQFFTLWDRIGKSYLHPPRFTDNETVGINEKGKDGTNITNNKKENESGQAKGGKKVGKQKTT